MQQSGICAVDVRTPAEFERGHIPGAVNLPLFSNEERAVVGTEYKKVGRKNAILEGLKFVGPRLNEFAQKGIELADEKPLLIHCWRGGMRSFSMAWLLNLMEVETFTLKKGYKGFRNYVLKKFQQPYKFLVLGGKTGSAKTFVLQELQKKGEQIIDLEGLALHRGSAFGSLGQSEKITQEQFENELAFKLHGFNLEKNIWIEDESRHVGRTVLPLAIWELMRSSPVIYLDIPQSVRVEYLMSQYGSTNEVEFLKQAFFDIKKRLGDVNFHTAISAIEGKDLKSACKIALDYYDRAYEHGLAKRNQDSIRKIKFENINLQEIVNQLLLQKQY